MTPVARALHTMSQWAAAGVRRMRGPARSVARAVATPRGLAVALLAVAAAGMLGAWQLQAAAARGFTEARLVQEREPDANDSDPPAMEDYEAILATLDRSIEIRRDIDETLAEVEDIVAGLRAAQQDATTITTNAQATLDAIAAQLGAALTAADDSAGNLRGLRGELAESARLARLIAAELERLDRSMGPSVGGDQ